MLPDYRKILIATDLSANSEEAFKHAIMMARCHDAKIHMLHVVPEIDASFRSYVNAVMGNKKLADFDKLHEEEAFAEIREELDQFAKAELADFPDDLDRFSGTEVLHGNPVHQILKAADRLDVDVIVMGTHGKGAIEHAFLGSVAEKVLRKCHRPVFVVPLPVKGQ